MSKGMILVVLVALGSLKVTASEPGSGAVSFLSKIKSGVFQTPVYMKKAGGYLISTGGAKDLALAWGVGMGLTAMHEGAHAVTAKALCGTPINLVLGATPGSNRSYFRVGGVTLGGFNPATGYAHTGYNNGNKPLKEAAICAAGPICGALSSLAVLLLLRNTDGLYMTKAAAAYGLFNHTLGIAGIGGAWIPGQDVNRAVKNFREYRASKNKK